MIRFSFDFMRRRQKQNAIEGRRKRADGPATLEDAIAHKRKLEKIREMFWPATRLGWDFRKESPTETVGRCAGGSFGSGPLQLSQISIQVSPGPAGAAWHSITSET